MENRLKFLGWWLALIGVGIVRCIYYVLVAWIVWLVRGTFWDNWLDRLTYKIEEEIVDCYEELN